MDTNTPDPMVGVILQNYRIVEHLAEGGMGVVYRAEHISMKRPAAIKILKPEHCQKEVAIKRFYQEGQLVNQLRHPNIVDIFDFGLTDDQRVYYIMELLEGENLAQRLERLGPLSLQESIPVMKQAAAALVVAHEKGIIHRDLKPENLWMNPDGTVKLLDFGIAKLVGIEDVQEKLTKTGMIVGTPHYMSPEQINGSQVDARSDVYSMGLVFYEMLIGKNPFVDLQLGEILAAHILGDLKTITDTLTATTIPAGAKALIFRALAREPQERYQSMSDMLQDLRAIEEGRDPRGGRRRLQRKRGSVPRLALIGGGSALAGAMFVAGWYLASQPPALPPSAPPPPQTQAALPLDDATLRARALDLLQQRLQAQEPRLRAAAATALGDIHDRPSRPRLEALLGDPDPLVRASAARALGALGDSAALSALRGARPDAPPALRVALESSALMFDDRDARAGLRELLRSEDPAIVTDAALALADAPEQDEARKALQKLNLQSLPAEEQLHILTARASLRDDSALEALLRAKESADEGSQLLAAAALASIGDDAGLAALRAALSSKELNTRVTAAAALASLGEVEGRAVLEEALSAPDATLRRQAASALGSLMDHSAVPKLVPLLQDPDGEAQIAAAASLVILLPDSKQLNKDSLAWLDEALQSEDASTRANAVVLAAQLPMEEALPRLRAAMEDKDETVAVKAAGMILASTTMQDARGSEALRAMRDSASGGRINILARGSQADEEGAQIRREAFRSKDRGKRDAALDAASLAGDQDLLREGLKDKDPALRLKAARQLAAMKIEAGLSVLRKESKNKDPEIAAQATATLMQLGEPVSLPEEQTKTLMRSPRASERVAGVMMAKALPRAQAQSLLKSAIKDPSVRVRRAALEVAESLGLRGILLQGSRDRAADVRTAADLALARLTNPTPDTNAQPSSTNAEDPTEAPSSEPSTPEDPSSEPASPREEVSISADEAAKRKRDATLKFSQAELSLKAGRAGDALRLFKEANTLSARPDIQWHFGLCYQALGNSAKDTAKRVKNWSSAKDAFLKFAKKFPADSRTAKAKAYAQELAENIQAENL